MSLFESLPRDEVSLITTYIDDFGLDGDSPYPSQERASTEHVLREWNRQKGKLYSLLGNNFIISKQIEYQQPNYELMGLMEDVRRKHWDFLHKLKRLFAVVNWSDPERAYRDVIDDLIAADSLIENKVHEITCRHLINSNYSGLPLADGKILAIQPGAKIIKILGKLAQSYNIEGFEAFRLDHSLALNRKKLTGKLCLSIHPLDYMTMSDNNSGWSSCMSWTESGGYRLGTVEMMNSPNVIVAYLASDDNYRFYDGEWNNKKWRCLYVVEDCLAASVKGYPYQCDELNKIVLQWIGELANSNWDNADFHFGEEDIMEFKPSQELVTPWGGIQLRFTTDRMYNDFGSTKHLCILSPQICEHKNSNNVVFVHYSGEATCMWCGGYAEFSDEAIVVCNNCVQRYHCECCEETIYGESYEVDGALLCYSCYENCTEECEITNEIHLEHNMINLYLCSQRLSQGLSIHDMSLGCLRVVDEVWDNEQWAWSTYFDSEPIAYRRTWGTDYYVTPDMLTAQGAEKFDYFPEAE